jgi:hypothetical protein
MITVQGKYGELAGDDRLPQWMLIDWLRCECGEAIFSPRSVQGYTGKWGLCSSATCRKVWKLSTSENDVVGTLDGIMPEQFHSNLIG